MALFDGKMDWYDLFVPGSNITPLLPSAEKIFNPGNAEANGGGGFGARGNNSAEETMNSWNYTDLIKDSQQFEHDEAELNRKWQEEMSNSAYQRATADMQKAGLNPALMFANGAEMAYTGTGAQAHSTISTQENTKLQYAYGGINAASNLLKSIGDFMGTFAGTGKYKSTNMGFK